MHLPHEAMLLRIFIGESDRWHHQPLYEAIVLKARELHLAGATVLRGPMGYGKSSRLVEWLRNCAWQAWQAQAASLRERATRCPLCAHVRACESAHVRSFVGWVSDGLAWSRYVESRGLCLPHLVRCQALVREEPLRERLNGAQIKQMERLQDEMRELVGKLDRKSVV